MKIAFVCKFIYIGFRGVLYASLLTVCFFVFFSGNNRNEQWMYYHFSRNLGFNTYSLWNNSSCAWSQVNNVFLCSKIITIKFIPNITYYLLPVKRNHPTWVKGPLTVQEQIVTDMSHGLYNSDYTQTFSKSLCKLCPSHNLNANQ